MMMPELPHRKAARVFRHWPTGHDDARSRTAFAPGSCLPGHTRALVSDRPERPGGCDPASECLMKSFRRNGP